MVNLPILLSAILTISLKLFAKNYEKLHSILFYYAKSFELGENYLPSRDGRHLNSN